MDNIISSNGIVLLETCWRCDGKGEMNFGKFNQYSQCCQVCEGYGGNLTEDGKKILKLVEMRENNEI